MSVLSGCRIRLASHLAGLLAVGLVVCGCFPASLPSQSKPACSWTTQPPSDADALCTAIFRTLQEVLRAEMAGDQATLRRLVVKREVAERIASHRSTLRAQGVRSLHIVPSVTLDGSRSRRIGAVFFLVGKGVHGKLRKMETVYLRSENGRMVVVADVPGEEW